MSLSAFFEDVPLAQPDPIFHLNTAYAYDQDPRKVNVGVGAYRTDKEKPWVLPVVKMASEMILQSDIDHEYLPITGLLEFTEASSKLILGQDSLAIAQNRVATIQGISGTGSLRIGAEFLAKYKPNITVYISNPTWGPHRTIFNQVGLKVKEYPYYDNTTNSVDINGWINVLKEAPTGSCFVLHACAHNPTGLDPSPNQWKEVAHIMMERNHFPFFDCAYQGFASGNLDQDAYSVRLFVSLGMEMFISQSYSKNLGLYNERVGCLVSVNKSSQIARNVKSQLAKIIRPMISNPPAFGARIVSIILNNDELYKEWLNNLKEMTSRIHHMRQMLYDLLTTLDTPGDWTHIIKQQGMFSYTGLNETQSKRLREEFHIYLTDNGRISIPGLTTKNVSYVAECIDLVVRSSTQY